MDNQAEQPETRCGAKTRQGTTCQNKPEPGKKRCRIHGGAPGSGAPIGNKNSIKHGHYSKASIEKRRLAKQMLIESLDVLDSLKG